MPLNCLGNSQHSIWINLASDNWGSSTDTYILSHSVRLLGKLFWRHFVQHDLAQPLLDPFLLDRLNVLPNLRQSRWLIGARFQNTP